MRFFVCGLSGLIISLLLVLPALNVYYYLSLHRQCPSMNCSSAEVAGQSWVIGMKEDEVLPCQMKVESSFRNFSLCYPDPFSKDGCPFQFSCMNERAVAALIIGNGIIIVLLVLLLLLLLCHCCQPPPDYEPMNAEFLQKN